ncbi:MAG: cytochrome c oxidase subunit II [Salinigranum sp.]
MSRRTQALIGAVVAASLVALFSSPASAARYSSTAEAIYQVLWQKLLYLAVIVGILVEGALWYAVVRYRNSGEAKPSRHNPRFHIAFVAAVAIVLLFVGYSAFQAQAALNENTPPEGHPPADAVRVHVVAAQWLWTFKYPGHNVTSRRTLVIPVNRTVALTLTSSDVIHSFHAPSLGLKQDVTPGYRNHLVFTPTKTGSYQLYCAQYCGTGHSNMLGTIKVVNRSAYRRWLRKHGGGSSAPNGTNASLSAPNGSSASGTGANAADPGYSGASLPGPNAARVAAVETATARGASAASP